MIIYLLLWLGEYRKGLINRHQVPSLMNVNAEEVFEGQDNKRAQMRWREPHRNEGAWITNN